MNEPPIVSLIIPVFNEAHHLRELLPALLQQSDGPMEIIVADAGSADGSRQIAGEHGCRIVPGGRPAHGRNAGAQVARGDYLVFLDADTRLFGDDFVAQSVAEVQRRRLGAGIVGYRAYYRPGDKGYRSLTIRLVDKFILGVLNAGQHWWRLLGFPVGQGVYMIAHRDTFQKLAGFNVKAEPYEDSELLLHMHRRFPAAPPERSSVGILKNRYVFQSMRRFDIKGRVFWPLSNSFRATMLRWLTQREHGYPEYWELNKEDYDR